ncbi:MAG: SUMF1/EgtB/PvdO family nonheme iron enzyme [Bacteroidales bacterium]|nr:SUMF1/EgtB/PvdO family nonheme iron enzyme [Bacteroidales bacterium]
MRNVLFFILMIMSIVLVINAKKNINKRTSFIKVQNYIENVNGINLKMIYVEGGLFKIGNDSKVEGYKDESPATELSINSYYIGCFEVTQKQWNIIMEGNDLNNEEGDLPINNVSWYDANSFCNKLSLLTGKNYQLPTEEQWEYAARGGIKSNICRYSGDDNIDKVAWYNSNSQKKVHIVGSKKPNELGVYDMSGNLYEWCSDTYRSYKYINNEDNNFRGESKVIRGGCWRDYSSSCRVVSRNFQHPSATASIIGFRIVCIP